MFWAQQMHSNFSKMDKLRLKNMQQCRILQAPQIQEFSINKYKGEKIRIHKQNWTLKLTAVSWEKDS